MAGRRRERLRTGREGGIALQPGYDPPDLIFGFPIDLFQRAIIV
jgi:hypothetical protein